MYTHEQRKELREQDWSANVRDEFKGMSTQEVINALEPRRNNLHFVFENALRDFNFSGIIRVSNAFACGSIAYTGFRKYDPRGAVGTNHYELVTHWNENQFLMMIGVAKDNGFKFVVAESDVYPNSQSLVNYQWNDHTLLMLGEEAVGVSQKYLDMADDVVYVPQVGSVRSMNVAGTAHILAYDYMIKTGRFK